MGGIFRMISMPHYPTTWGFLANTIDGVSFGMLGPSWENASQFAPLYIDKVSLVPEPGGIFVIFTGIALLFTNRKRHL